MTTLFTGLCLLLLGLALFYFVRYLCVRRPCHRDSPWMHVSSVDRDGNEIGRGQWVRIPRPDRIERNGLNHVVKYVARLVKSRSDDAHLIITSTDGNKACLIYRDKDQLKILEMVYTGSSTPTTRKEPFSFPPHPSQSEKEQAIRNLFADLGITAAKDFVHEYNGYVDAMRDLHYPIGSDIAQATLIVQRLLREVHHIRDAEGLDFSFRETCLFGDRHRSGDMPDRLSVGKNRAKTLTEWGSDHDWLCEELEKPHSRYRREQTMNMPIFWKQSLLIACWCWLMVLGAAAAFAQSQGRLRLPDLPPMAHVYVDAKPVVVQDSLLLLSPGWHHVQVEKQDKSGLQAYRRFVQVIADKTVDVRIIWQPVRLAIGADGLANYSPPGITGPYGEPGPSARPYKPLPAKADLAMLRSPLQEARDILVSDFEAQVQDALNGLAPLATPVYLYVPGPPVAEPPGNPGPVGPHGQPDVPAEVRLIEASTGVPLRDRIEQSLGLPEMQQTLSALQARLESLSRTPRFYIPLEPETLHVLTPAWKTALDQEWKDRKAKAPQEFHGDNFGIMGLPGAPGRRGPDGIAPAGAAPIRVSLEQEKQLLNMLTTDTATRTKIAQLRQQLTELTRRVYLAEGIYLEQFPPSAAPPKEPIR